MLNFFHIIKTKTHQKWLADLNTNKMNQIRNQYYDKENCHAEKIPISSLLQFPVWIYLSTSIRNLAFGTGGIRVK